MQSFSLVSQFAGLPLNHYLTHPTIAGTKNIGTKNQFIHIYFKQIKFVHNHEDTINGIGQNAKRPYFHNCRKIPEKCIHLSLNSTVTYSGSSHPQPDFSTFHRNQESGFPRSVEQVFTSF